MATGNIIESIKACVYNIVEEEYKKYLQSHKLLTMDRELLLNVVDDYYVNNSKKIKSEIRETLKTQYKEEYNSTMIENIILDLFQERELNIIKITNEIITMQEKNLKQISIPIVNNSLNLNISHVDGYIVINSTNPKKIEGHYEAYEIISNYKFLHSINNELLQNYPDNEKINVIKKNIDACKTNITIVCYYLKQEQEQ
jgi:hypothetical protein